MAAVPQDFLRVVHSAIGAVCPPVLDPTVARMALTETRPETGALDSTVAAAAPTTIDGVLGTGEHKTIGRVYLGGGVIGLIGALVVGVIAVFMSNNLDNLGADQTDMLANLWSLGRDLALFGGLVPIFVGLAIYLVPLQVGAPSLAFARGAAASLWTWMLGTGLLVLAYVLNGGPGGLRKDSVVLWAAALAMMVGALVWAMICISVTVLGARTQGMTLERVPLTTWAFFVFSLVGVLSLPILMGELLLAFLRIRFLHVPIAESASLTTIMDGQYLAPAVYWLGIPVLGMAVDIIGVHSERPAIYHRSIMAAIGVFGILTYGADIVGLASVRTGGVDFDNGFFVGGMIAVIVPVLVTLVLAGQSLRSGVFRLRTALVGVLLAGLLLLLATTVSLLGLIEPIMRLLDDASPGSVDLSQTLILNGTRFHEGIRALLLGSALLAVIGALHHWATKIWGRQLSEPLGLLSLLATAGGSVVWATGEILAGFDDQPWLPARSTDDFSAGLGALGLVGAVVLAVAAVSLGVNMAISLVSSKPAGSSSSPWSGVTLEWATSSPPPVGNFPAPPIVASATPLLDELMFDGEEPTNEISTEGAAASVTQGDTA